MPPLSIKQLVVIVNINLIAWMIVSRTQCSKNSDSKETDLTQNTSTTTVPPIFDDEPIFPAGDAQAFNPIQNRPNKKLIRMASHLACPFEQETERKF